MKHTDAFIAGVSAAEIRSKSNSLTVRQYYIWLLEKALLKVKKLVHTTSWKNSYEESVSLYADITYIKKAIKFFEEKLAQYE